MLRFLAPFALLLPACSPAQQPTASVEVSGVSVTRLSPGLKNPWSVAFLPEGAMLITEKFDGLVRVDKGGKGVTRITGLPKDAVTSGQSGYLDVVLDPDFVENRIIYVAYLQGTKKANRLAVVKAVLDGNALSGAQIIFKTSADRRADFHPGGRMLFLPDKTLLLSVGDAYALREKAQDLASHYGKILRLDRDGKAPEDNPFAKQLGALPEIWTLGHRNIQGLTLDSETNAVWAHEHGPIGGDEINLIKAGSNYGWPRVSHGLNYDGSKVSDLKTAPDYAEAKKIWVPSIAPSGATVLRDTLLSDWNGQMLVGALAGSMIVRLKQAMSGQWDEVDRMFVDLGERIRDVRQAPDGSIVALTDGAGELWQIRPKEGR